jgi:hypothetical protein
VNFKFIPSDYRILFNNTIAIAWTTYLSFTCGQSQPSSSGSATAAATAAAAAVAGSSGGGSGAGGPGSGSVAAAASALLSAIPCSKVPGALGSNTVSQSVQQVVAMERMVAHWGTQVRCGAVDACMCAVWG